MIFKNNIKNIKFKYIFDAYDLIYFTYAKYQRA